MVRRGGRSENITVKIPPGIESGKKLRLRGHGNAGAGGAPAGDLLVTVYVAPHPVFRRNGKNLEVKLPITVKEAILGAKVDVPTPGGTVALKIPPGSSSGRRLRVSGQGVLSTSGPPGDLIVELQIKVPERCKDPGVIDEQTRAALERIEQLYDQPIRGTLRW